MRHDGEDQLNLMFEETEAALARVAAKLESVAPDREPRHRNVNRGRLPAHLERVEQVIDVESLRATVRRFWCDAVRYGRRIFAERFADGALAPWARRTGRLTDLFITSV